ncbi:MAG: hypothetical protein HY286_08280 [Planctomycetes bacterium]|nr:hypothetical protein [Planctomycetota bacterium]
MIRYLFLNIVLLLLFVSCARSTTGGYWADRLNDTVDMIPLSVSVGPGLYAGVQVTSFFGTGVGYAEETSRVGWFPTKSYNADARGGLVRFGRLEGWQCGFVFACMGMGLSSDSNAMIDASTGNTFFFFPVVPVHCGGDIYYDAVSVLNISANVHIGIVGIHAGISPVNVVDWLLGWFTIDIAGDDMNARFPEPVPASRPTDSKSEQ